MKYLKISILPIALVAMLSCEKKVVVDQNTNPSVTNSTTAPSDSKNNIKEDLPAAALGFLNVNFANDPVANYEVKTVPVTGKTYEVKLNNGVEVDFNENGNWTQLKDPKGIATALVPASITKYVTANYKGVNITSIDKEKNKIKVDLSNDIDLDFDNNGNFVRIDK